MISDIKIIFQPIRFQAILESVSPYLLHIKKREIDGLVVSLCSMFVGYHPSKKPN